MHLLYKYLLIFFFLTIQVYPSLPGGLGEEAEGGSAPAGYKTNHRQESPQRLGDAAHQVPKNPQRRRCVYR